MVLVKTIKREKRIAEMMIKNGNGWRKKSSAKESHANPEPKVIKSAKKEEPKKVDENTDDETEDAFTGVADLTLDKAKKFIGKCDDVEKLNFIAANDGRKTVEDAAKARIKKLK